MIHHSLQLSNALDAAGAAQVTEALKAIAGVGSVDAAVGSSRIAITFDEDRTSTQELSTVVARAGQQVRVAKPHGAGSCCGGCGG